MAGQSNDDEGIVWPGFVDALTTMTMVMTLIMMVLGIVVFGLSQNISRKVIERLAEAANVDAATSQSTEKLTDEILAALGRNATLASRPYVSPGPDKPMAGIGMGATEKPSDQIVSQRFAPPGLLQDNGTGGPVPVPPDPTITSTTDPSEIARLNGRGVGPGGWRPEVKQGTTDPDGGYSVTKGDTMADGVDASGPGGQLTEQRDSLPSTDRRLTEAFVRGAAGPGTGFPGSQDPVASGPEATSEPQRVPSDTVAALPRPLQSETHTADAASVESSKSEAAKSEAAKSEAAKSEAAKSEAAKTEAVRTEYAKAEARAASATPGTPAGDSSVNAAAAAPTAAAREAVAAERPTDRANQSGTTQPPMQMGMTPTVTSNRGEPAVQSTETIASERPADLVPPPAGGSVVASSATVTIRFQPQAIQLDTESSARLDDIARTSEVFQAARRIEVKGIADIEGGSVTDARRIAYHRVMIVRGQLLQAGLPSEKLSLRLVDTFDPTSKDVVTLTPQP